LPLAERHPPAGEKVTVRVEFLDHLTGKTHSAQKLCEIELPADE
jgi:hypothetical protein